MKSLRLYAPFLLFFLINIGGEQIRPSQAYSADSVTASPSTVVSVDSIEALRNVKLNTTVIVTGYYALGDGGGGLYLWSADSEAPENGGTIIAPHGHTAPGRWMRAPEHPVSVRWFGARGNGVADDTIPIEACINAIAAAGGGSIYFPPGTYNVTGLRIAGGVNNVIFIGAGWQSVIHNTDISGKHAIHFGVQNSDTRNYGIAVRDLAITGNNRSGDGIRFDAGGWYDARGLMASVTEFHHLKVEGHGGDGIHLGKDGNSGAGNSIRIRDCTIRANGRTGVVAVGQTNLVSIDGCSITSNGKDGIEFNHVASTNTVRESLIADNKRYGVYAFRCEEPIVAFNGFNRNGGGAIALSGDPKRSIKYTEAALVIGNLFGDNGKTAEVQREVSLYATKGSSIVFNYFYGTGQNEMIYLGDYTYDTTIQGNHFKNLTTEVKVKVKQLGQGAARTTDIDRMIEEAGRNEKN